MVEDHNYKGIYSMSREPFDIRGDSVIGIYPDNFQRGHIPGRRGTRRVLCKKSIYDSIPEDDREEFISKLYYQKKSEIEKERSDKRLKLDEKKKRKHSAPIREASEIWLSEVKKLLSLKTANEYKSSIDLYIESNGNHSVSDFDRQYNIDFLNALSKKKKIINGNTISANTQHKHVRHFKRFINWCHEEEYIENVKKIIMPKVQEQEMETFTIEEVDRLYNFLKYQANGPHPRKLERRHTNLYRAFILARNTLLRTGAIWSLKLENIDIEHGYIRIRENDELDWKAKKMKWPNKPINKTLLEFLETDLAHRSPEERYFLDSGKGKPWTSGTSGLVSSMKKCCREINLPDSVKPFHWGIRATYITWLLNSGVDPVKVQHLADHAKLATTMLYFNTKQSSQKIAVDMLG